MRSPRILLIGIGGVYNYGCEAIVRGTEVIIRREYPNADIIYASHRFDDDLMRLEGTDVHVIERPLPKRYSIKNICKKVLSLFGINWSPMVESLRILAGVDAVFSIGGDIYTLRADGNYPMAFPKFGDAVVKFGIPYALWGASVGPFTDNAKIEKAFIRHLNGLSVITARETSTVAYLRSLGIIDNVVSCADPAYVVAPEIKSNGTCKGDKFTIGLNLSPLSIQFIDQSADDVIQEQVKTVERLIKIFDSKIVLIPHVVADTNEGDDDLRYLKKIKKLVGQEYQKSLTLLDTDLGFIGTKKELVKCDLVIAARMHCAINALTAHVPTILIAYSRKAIGMCQYVYGNNDWVLSLKDFTKEDVLEDKVRSIRNQNNYIRDYLYKRIPDIQKESYLPMRRLKEILGTALLD